jgi:polar amino acid transport system permease protein
MADYLFGMDISPITQNIHLFYSAILLTVLISLVAIVLGFALGMLVGLARSSRSRLIRYPATAYVDVIRGTPLLVQLFLWYFGLSVIGINIDPLPAAMLAVGFHSSAYQAEIVRGGIQSIPKGQTEAARAVGMTHLQSMRFVILPQALRLILPPLSNEFVIVIKDSSLAYAISVAEITLVSYQLNARYYEPFTVFLFAALLYLILTYVTSTLMRTLERRVRIPGYGEQE